MITLKCKRRGSDFSARHHRKVPLCEKCARMLRKRGEGPIQMSRREEIWSDWHPLNSESLKIVLPNAPRVYEVRTNFTFGRLKGISSTVYIGSAVPSLKERLLRERIKNPERYLSRAEKLLHNNGKILQFRFIKTSGNLAARNLESKLLKDCELKHWELPLGNAVLPKPLSVDK